MFKKSLVAVAALAASQAFAGPLLIFQDVVNPQSVVDYYANPSRYDNYTIETLSWTPGYSNTGIYNIMNPSQTYTPTNDAITRIFFNYTPDGNVTNVNYVGLGALPKNKIESTLTEAFSGKDRQGALVGEIMQGVTEFATATLPNTPRVPWFADAGFGYHNPSIAFTIPEHVKLNNGNGNGGNNGNNNGNNGNHGNPHSDVPLPGTAWLMIAGMLALSLRSVRKLQIQKA